MYNRDLQHELLRLSASFPVQTITGPRQSGKTTLCRMTFPDYHYINLENPETREEISTSLMAFIRNHPRLIIDEAQNMPEVFSAVQVAVDEDITRQYIVTGSSHPALLSKVKQSLAGRTAVHTLLPLSFHELGSEAMIDTDALILRGFFPVVWNGTQEPTDTYKAYYQTYLQRDVTDVLSLRNLGQFRRFILLLASRIGSELNAQSIANDVGVSVVTIQQWVSVLESSYIAFRLPPYYRNIGKRLIKASKIYFYDTGLACYLLGIHSAQELNLHPLRGALFENLVVCDMLKYQYNHNTDEALYFYRDNKKEVDLLVENGLHIDAYEIKVAQQDNSSFYGGLDYLRHIYGDSVQHTAVIYTGEETREQDFDRLVNYQQLLQRE